MSDDTVVDKECVFSYNEMYIIHGLLREVFLGFKLDDNERIILGNMEHGRSLQKRISNVFHSDHMEYKMLLSLEDVVMIRNSFIVAAIEFNHYNIYTTHMGRDLQECLLLLRRLDLEMVNWRSGDTIPILS